MKSFGTRYLKDLSRMNFHNGVILSYVYYRMLDMSEQPYLVLKDIYDSNIRFTAFNVQETHQYIILSTNFNRYALNINI